MISATEALTLPTAKLSDEEFTAAEALEAAIEAHVRQFMERRGVNFETEETRANVVAEVNQRLKLAGYLPQWQPLIKQHRLNAAKSQHVGFRLSLAPTDDSYRAVSVVSSRWHLPMTPTEP